jgi:flagellar biosynthetic protein FliP
MQAQPTAQPLDRLRTREFWFHYGEMIAAMVVGMMVFYPLLTWVLDRLGRGDLLDAAIPTALVMATSMTLGMSIWMAIRRHSWHFILEMGAAMFLSFVVLFPTFWAGLLSGDGMLIAGHIVMLPAMAAVILRH